MPRAYQPMVSSVTENSFAPSALIDPHVGLKPNTPQNDAGRITEPPVCVPSVSGTIRSATAAAEPLDEPPGVRVRSCGLRVTGRRPCAANSIVSVLPMRIAPALRSIETHAASLPDR